MHPFFSDSKLPECLITPTFAQVMAFMAGGDGLVTCLHMASHKSPKLGQWHFEQQFPEPIADGFERLFHETITEDAPRRQKQVSLFTFQKK